MYPRMPWELVADPLRSAGHSLGTNDLSAVFNQGL